jgi:hypothetical protein
MASHCVGSQELCPEVGWPRITILLISVAYIARITGINLSTWLGSYILENLVLK